MRLLPRGGYLATCSCSHFMTDEMFRKMLQEAALDAGVTLRQIEARQQAPDHPILPGGSGDRLSEILPFAGGVRANKNLQQRNLNSNLPKGQQYVR